MLVRPGDPFDPDRLDRSLKTLYSTGLFQDVQLSRQGNTLVVHIVENPLVSSVAFEGNHEVNDKTLTPNVQLRSARGLFAADCGGRPPPNSRYLCPEGQLRRQRHAADHPLQDNRVDVVLQINEGPSTEISKIAIVGNHAFSEGRLSK